MDYVAYIPRRLHGALTVKQRLLAIGDYCNDNGHCLLGYTEALTSSSLRWTLNTLATMNADGLIVYEFSDIGSPQDIDGIKELLARRGRILVAIANNGTPAIKQRHDGKSGVSLRTAFDDYLLDRSPKSEKGLRYRFNRHIKDWLELDLCDIVGEMIEARHRRVSETSPTEANQVFRALKTIYNFAMFKYEKNGKPVVSVNPIQRLSRLKAWNKERARDRHIPLEKLQRWWLAALELNNSTVRDYLLVLLLTGLRSAEARTLKWSDVDFGAMTLTVRETKNGKDHSLPLSTLLFRILSNRASCRSTGDEYVFPGRSGNGCLGWPYKSIDLLEETTGIHFSPHDLRRTFNLLAEEAGLDATVRKRLLNHSTQDITEKHYGAKSSSRLKPAMDAVCAKIVDLVGPAALLAGNDLRSDDPRLIEVKAQVAEFATLSMHQTVLPSHRPILEIARVSDMDQVQIEAKILLALRRGTGTKKDFYRQIGACFRVRSSEMERILSEMEDRKLIKRLRHHHHWRYQLNEQVAAEN